MNERSKKNVDDDKDVSSDPEVIDDTVRDEHTLQALDEENPGIHPA